MANTVAGSYDFHRKVKLFLTQKARFSGLVCPSKHRGMDPLTRPPLTWPPLTRPPLPPLTRTPSISFCSEKSVRRSFYFLLNFKSHCLCLGVQESDFCTVCLPFSHCGDAICHLPCVLPIFSSSESGNSVCLSVRPSNAVLSPVWVPWHESKNGMFENALTIRGLYFWTKKKIFCPRWDGLWRSKRRPPIRLF